MTPRLGDESLWGRFRSRFAKVFERTGNIPDVGGNWLDAFDEGIGLVIAAVVVLLLLLFFIIPLLVAIVDLLVVLALGVVGLALRIALRRPWEVEATSSTGEILRWRVVGWKASGARVAEIAAELEQGRRPTPDESSRRAPKPTPAPAEPKPVRTPAPKPSRSVVIAFVVIGIVFIALSITMFTVVRNSEPSYVPPCERAGTGC